jgi:peroxiredoxin
LPAYAPALPGSRKDVALKILKSLVIIAVAALAFLFSCSSSTTAGAVRPVKERKPAPDFTLKDASGASVKLSDYRGKVVLLNFWATWCGPCKMEIPWFIEFQQQFKDQGFTVLGVAMDDDGWQSVKPYVAERKVNYRVLLGDDAVSTRYGGVDSLPTTFVIDKEGRIASAHVGLIGKNEYLGEIQTLLGIKQTESARLLPGAADVYAASANQ